MLIQEKHQGEQEGGRGRGRRRGRREKGKWRKRCSVRKGGDSKIWERKVERRRERRGMERSRIGGGKGRKEERGMEGMVGKKVRERENMEEERA